MPNLESIITTQSSPTNAESIENVGGDCQQNLENITTNQSSPANSQSAPTVGEPSPNFDFQIIENQDQPSTSSIEPAVQDLHGSSFHDSRETTQIDSPNLETLSINP
ncbi:hypothetical protein ACOSQ2_031752 [Xanthoceras sorbifolium]